MPNDVLPRAGSLIRLQTPLVTRTEIRPGEFFRSVKGA